MGNRRTRTWLLLTAMLGGGCASGGRMDVLESRLRSQEDSISQLQSQLADSKSQLQAANRESIDLKTQLAAKAKAPPVEQFSALGQVQGISLNKFLTGGLDRDGAPGDELLSAVVVPTDADGNLVKVPGAVAVTVLDLSKPESEQRVGHWEYSAKDSENLWQTGFLGSGYIVRVPWQATPRSPTLLVHARLKTVDGRQFDTSQSIRITPPNGSTNGADSLAKTGTAGDASEPAGKPIPASGESAPSRAKTSADGSWWDRQSPSAGVRSANATDAEKQ